MFTVTSAGVPQFVPGGVTGFGTVPPALLVHAVKLNVTPGSGVVAGPRSCTVTTPLVELRLTLRRGSEAPVVTYQ